MMGYPDATRGADIYTYTKLMNDMNTVHPHIVGSLSQMKKAMRGDTGVPKYWAKVLDELLGLAVAGHRHPPAPGPFWHPQPMDEKKRRLAAVRLVEWQAYKRVYNTTVAELAQMTPGRVSLIRHGRSAILPTELDRIATAFGTDVGKFLEGPPRG